MLSFQHIITVSIRKEFYKGAVGKSLVSSVFFTHTVPIDSDQPLLRYSIGTWPVAPYWTEQLQS